jgi:preprotein translocase subunit SecD
MRRGLVWSIIFMVALAALALGGTTLAGYHILRGLDLKGGVSVVLQPQGTADNAQLQQAVNIIENRVSGLNIANSSVQRQGHDVIVSLPGIKNSQQALSTLGETATLYFRPVYCEIPAYAAANPPATTVPTPSAGTTVPKSSATTKAALGQPSIKLTSADFPAADPAPTSTTTPPTTIVSNSSSGSPVPVNSPVSQSDCTASNAAQLPTTAASQDTQSASVILPVDPKAFGSSAFRYVLGPADMTGTSVSNALSEIDPSTGQYSVQLSLTSSGAGKFDNIASSRYACNQQSPSSPPPCSLEAFELDGVVESAPTFTSSSFNGNVQITGSFTSSQASSLATVLKYGSLPVRFVPQSVQTVSATIGKDTLRAGILAGIGGIVIVMFYMLFYYRALALVVFTGLILGGAILYSILALLSQGGHIALTLAGVTGIIVSVGITVDSYIVYFERLKDEVRAGRTVRQSVDRSFARAFRTVITADVVSFLAAVILYYLSVGDVRNFAFTLGLATLLDVFTAFFYIRPAVILLGRRRTFTDNRVFGITRGLGGRVAVRET